MAVGCQQVGGLQAEVPGKYGWARPMSALTAPGVLPLPARRSRTTSVAAAEQESVARVVTAKAWPEMGMPKVDGF